MNRTNTPLRGLTNNPRLTPEQLAAHSAEVEELRLLKSNNAKMRRALETQAAYPWASPLGRAPAPNATSSALARWAARQSLTLAAASAVDRELGARGRRAAAVPRPRRE